MSSFVWGLASQSLYGIRLKADANKDEEDSLEFFLLLISSISMFSSSSLPHSQIPSHKRTLYPIAVDHRMVSFGITFAPT